MADVAIDYIPAAGGRLGHFGISLDRGDLKGGDELKSAVIISIFTERQARLDDKLINPGERRGWWANPQMGSRLWLLQRAKQTNETRTLARQYCEEALQWLVDQGIAERVSVETEWVRLGFLGIGITIIKPDQVAIRYQLLWDQVNNAIQQA